MKAYKNLLFLALAGVSVAALAANADPAAPEPTTFIKKASRME